MLGVLDDAGKVIFEKRNFVTNPLKSGKTADVYFSNMLKEDKKTVERLKNGTIQDYNDKIEKVKKTKGTSNKNHIFSPGTVQKMPD